VARYALFALGASPVVTWMLMAGIVLHGICYDFFFVTGQIYVDRHAPEKIRGAAQGFLVLCTLGLGMLIGAQIAGAVKTVFTPGVIESTGYWKNVWLVPAALSLAVAAIFGVLFRENHGNGRR
jgi:MFS family permease